MTAGRPPVAFLLLFAVALVGVLAFVGTMLVRGFGGPDEPRVTFAEELEALPVVVDVETSSDRIVGTDRARTLESQVTLSPTLTEDPDAAAEALTGVSWGYDRSLWQVEGLGSTAEVSYRAPMDPAPVLWWTRGVAALQRSDPQAALDCRITDAALHCEVQADDPDAARAALAGVPADGLQPWLDAARPDEGEITGFELQVGGQTITDPAALAG